VAGLARRDADGPLCFTGTRAGRREEVEMNRTLSRVLVLLPAAAVAAASLAAASPARDAFEARLAAELQLQSAEAAVPWAEANAAREANDHARAAALYGRVVELAPGFSHAKRRLAGEALKLGQRPRALTLAREALREDPSVENMVGLAGVLSHEGVGPGKPTPAETKEAFGLAARAAQKAPDDFYAQVMLAQIALQNGEEATFAKAAKRLLDIAPDEVATQHVAFIHALTERRFDDAEKTLRRARELGLPEEDAAKMTTVLAQARPAGWGLTAKVAWAGAVWLGGLFVLLTAGVVLSGAVLREAETLP
jgi:tetratricopeptide (TPR) repeat protein